ncbi:MULTISPECIES: glycerate kinase [unclassified Psychrobacter]|uniref:glycerate kinase n=1 Tax=unclassified Psychrobacter TaxID=196806 RepID=UPI0018F49F8C|nr:MULTISPECIES: glycerate kinase [unclassified Psychrobacter]
MNVLIAPDSFKESLEAQDVCRAIRAGFARSFPDAHYTLLPMADGGEGTAVVLSYALGGSWQHLTVHDALMRPIEAKYLLLPDGTAVIETAEACGLQQLATNERNPLHTSTYGVGELIKHALNKGATRFILGLGGSATNDAGMGMLTALGMRLLDAKGMILEHGGGQLVDLHTIDATHFEPLVAKAVFDVACDVTNPLCGESGASAVFAPQKGANAQQVQTLDDNLQHFATMCAQHGYADYQNAKGAGAAGGLGFALLSFCGARLQSGFNIIAEKLNLETHIIAADLVITGEGKFDTQTPMGKVAGGISQLAKAFDTPVLAICGSVDIKIAVLPEPFTCVVPSIQTLAPIEDILAQGYDNIEKTAASLAAAIKLGQQLSSQK